MIHLKIYGVKYIPLKADCSNRVYTIPYTYMRLYPCMHTMYQSNYDTIMLTHEGMSELFAHGVTPAHLPYMV